MDDVGQSSMIREVLIPVHIHERSLARARLFAPNKFTEDMPSAEVLACATNAECAVGFELASISMEITVEAGPDVDRDLLIAGHNIEVKNLDADNKCLLIYPRRKGLAELERRRCDEIVLTRCTISDPRRCIILGWIAKDRFLASCKVSGTETSGGYDGLWLGTPYVHSKHLSSIDTLEERLKERTAA